MQRASRSAKAEERRRRAEPPRHHHPLPARPGDLRQAAHFRPRGCYRLCRSKAYLFRGVEIRWSCDPALVKERHDPARGGAALPRRPVRLPRRRHRGPAAPSPPAAVRRRGQLPRRRRPRRMGVAWLASTDDEGFLNTYATPSRRPRAARTRPACAPALAEGAARLWRAGEQPQGRADHRRGPVRRRGRHALASSSATRSSRARPRTS